MQSIPTLPCPYQKGTRVRLTRVRDEKIRGKFGSIDRFFKSLKEARILVDDGSLYRALIENIDIVHTHGNCQEEEIQ